MTEKETPPVGVEPDASHLQDECPRLLDHRGFPICHRSLIQVIHILLIEILILKTLTKIISFSRK